MRAAFLALALAACSKGDDSNLPPDTDADTDDTDVGDTDACYTLADGSCVTETFVEPPVLQPDDQGVYHLEFGPSEVTIAGQRHCVRGYNNSYPGPTIDVAARSGTDPRQVRVDLMNAFTTSAWRSLEGGSCTCSDDDGLPCESHVSCSSHDDHECTCVDDAGEACEHAYDFNLTNLHFHGGHVEPDAANGGGCVADGWNLCRDCDSESCDGTNEDDTCFFADDVLQHVPPGYGTQHRFDLDEDGTHHAGLFWYHPHIHGATAIQVASGAAGALIVRGDIDEVDGIKDAKERLMVFGTPPIGEDGYPPLADSEVCTDDTITFDDFSVATDFLIHQLNVINGVRRPRLVTAPGQVETWRIVHAGYLDEVWFGLFKGTDSECTTWSTAPGDAMPFRQYSRDGITLPETYDSDYLFMSPGYRIEAAVGGDQFQDGDTWCMVAGRFLQDGDNGVQAPDDPPSPDDLIELFSRGDLIATVNVTSSYGTATETDLPTSAAIAAVAPTTDIQGQTADQRCAEAALQPNDDVDQVAMLQVGFWTSDDPDPCDCDNYNVNCQNFGETDRSVYPFDRDLVLGNVDHWRLGASIDGHPFHIHTNPVLLCPTPNPFDPIPFPHWRDTYLVNLARRVDVVTEYRKFTGAYVFHCHKLTHEDEGMMELIRVCDPAQDATCGDYAWDMCAPDDLVCIQKLAATKCAMESTTPADAAACSLDLGGPLGVCGDNACVDDDDCGIGRSCVDNVCRPG